RPKCRVQTSPGNPDNASGLRQSLTEAGESGGRESNPHRRLGKPGHGHYTTPAMPLTLAAARGGCKGPPLRVVVQFARPSHVSLATNGTGVALGDPFGARDPS